MERGDDEVAILIDVVEPDSQHPLFCGLEHAIVQGLLESHRAHIHGVEGVLAVVDGEPEPVALGGVGQSQAADDLGDVGRVGLLQAQHVGAVALDQVRELPGSTMFAQVVRNHPHDDSTIRGKGDDGVSSP